MLWGLCPLGCVTLIVHSGTLGVPQYRRVALKTGNILFSTILYIWDLNPSSAARQQGSLL